MERTDRCNACGGYSYFKFESGICDKCAAKKRKFQEYKDFYQHGRGKTFSFRNQVLDCRFRAGFSVEKTAEILNVEMEKLENEIDIIYQNAR